MDITELYIYDFTDALKKMDADEVNDYYKQLSDLLLEEEREIVRLEYEANERKVIAGHIRDQLEACSNRRIELVEEKINSLRAEK